MKKLFFALLPVLVFVACRAIPATPPTIFLAGDSTLANKADDRRPETGWGEMLSEFFNAPVVVDNHARNGRSTKSFRDEGLWQNMLAKVRPGDYVFIEFGHNDAKPDTARFSDPAAYAQNLTRFVEEVRGRNARPVLLTPIVRRKFAENGKLRETHGAYPAAVRQTAAILNAPLIDLNALTRDAINAYGPEESRSLFLWLAPGEHVNYPEGVQDDTHLNTQGARLLAGMVAADINRLRLPLRKFLNKSSLPAP